MKRKWATRRFSTMAAATTTALVSLLPLGCKPGSINQALDTACNAAGCISLSAMSANIDQKLGGNVVGYVSLVGALAIISAHGQARTAADPPATAMGTDVPINIASLSKVLTTIAVLQALAKHQPALTIDDKMAPFLPSDWTRGPNIGTITFKELMTHKAGFRVDGNGSNTTYAVLKQQIANGVTLADKAAPAQYNNLNFAIFRELLPFIAGSAGGFSDPGPATRASATAAFYIDYVRKHVLSPVGVTGGACKPSASNLPALSYPPPPIGATHGTDWGDWTLSCGGGGWVLSAADLYKVMLDLAGGNVLLSDAQKAQMNGNCLGWDCSVGTQVDFVGKNGILQTGSLGLWTFFGIFKGTVPVIVLVNSNTPGNITGIVSGAFNAATVPHP